jgi:aminoglycoside phosphotransferase (APT) family kinase protein
MSTDDLTDRLGRVMRSTIEGLTRLSGGASRETWAFDSIEQRTGTRKQLILRRDPPSSPSGPPTASRGGMELEARLLSAAARAGVPVPGVRAAGPASPERLETSYLVMDRIAGETIARKILRDPEYATARTVLAGQCGEALAKLHRIDPETVPGLEQADPLARYRVIYDQLSVTLSYRSAVFEWTFAWLESNRPTDRPQTLVHGDFRLGNLIVNGDGLASVLDWELAHQGDPMEDLGWLCVKAWRFGAAPEVGGFGSRDDLVAGYERSGGVVDEEALLWWIVAGTLIWGVMCMMQSNAHLSGALRSVELAAIGRRVPEQEHDLLLLLAPEDLHTAKQLHAAKLTQRDQPARVASDEFGVPSVRELIVAVQEFLERDVMTTATGRVQFHARVAANALGIAARQVIATSPPLETNDDVALMAKATVARLAVANPKYLDS